MRCTLGRIRERIRVLTEVLPPDDGGLAGGVGAAAAVVEAHGTATTPEIAMAAIIMVLENCILEVIDWKKADLIGSE